MIITVKAGSVEITITEANQEDRITSLKFRDQKESVHETLGVMTKKCLELIQAQNIGVPDAK